MEVFFPPQHFKHSNVIEIHNGRMFEQECHIIIDIRQCDGNAVLVGLSGKIVGWEVWESLMMQVVINVIVRCSVVP